MNTRIFYSIRYDVYLCLKLNFLKEDGQVVQYMDNYS